MLQIIGNVLFWLAMLVGGGLWFWMFFTWCRHRHQDKVQSEFKRECWMKAYRERKKKF